MGAEVIKVDYCLCEDINLWAAISLIRARLLRAARPVPAVCVEGTSLGLVSREGGQDTGRESGGVNPTLQISFEGKRENNAI